MPARFHSRAHLHPRCRQITLEFLRFLAALQSPLFQSSGLGIYKRNLLEARGSTSAAFYCAARSIPADFANAMIWLAEAAKRAFVSYDLPVPPEFIKGNTRAPSVRAAMEDSRGAI
jgi:hypothetical protein